MLYLSVCLALNTYILIVVWNMGYYLKPHVDHCVDAIELLLVVLFFVFFGWKVGILSVIGILLFGGILFGLALRTADFFKQDRSIAAPLTFFLLLPLAIVITSSVWVILRLVDKM